MLALERFVGNKMKWNNLRKEFLCQTQINSGRFNWKKIALN